MNSNVLLNKSVLCFSIDEDDAYNNLQLVINEDASWYERIIELLNDDESFVRAKAVNLLEEIVVKNIDYKGNSIQVVCFLCFLFCLYLYFGIFTLFQVLDVLSEIKDC